MSSDYPTLALTVGVIMGLIEVIKLLISRMTGNGAKGIKDEITRLKENHLHQLDSTLNKIDARTEEMNNKLVQIIELLKLMNQKR